MGQREILAIMLADMESKRITGKLANAGQLGETARLYASQFPIYGEITISNKSSDYRFQKSNKVTREGVYYTILVYAPLSSLNSTQYSVYWDENLDQKVATLLPGGPEPYLSVHGDIIMMNSYGYLNAE